MWYVYILSCSDATLYTGVTKDVVRRLNEHNHTKKAARYTRTRRPVTLLRYFEFENCSLAFKEEYRIKHLSRKEKLKLCGILD
jgi:putative endonuclease